MFVELRKILNLFCSLDMPWYERLKNLPDYFNFLIFYPPIYLFQIAKSQGKKVYEGKLRIG